MPNAKLQRICFLHGEIRKELQTTLEKAIEIGELLTQVKAKLEHGEWGHWCKDNLPFSIATATNYMKAFHNRERLKSLDVRGLAEAYKERGGRMRTPVSGVRPAPG